MAESDPRSYGDGVKGRLPNDATDMEAWRRGRNHAMLQKAWEVRRQEPPNQGFSFASGVSSGGGVSEGRSVGGAAVLVLVLILIGVGVMGRRPGPRSESGASPASTGTTSGSTSRAAQPSPQAPAGGGGATAARSKPSASIPLNATRSAAGSVPAPGSAMTPPAEGLEGEAPAATPAGTPPAMAPMVLSAIHEKHFGGICAGRLTLTGAGLTFECFVGPQGSVSIAMGEIESADNNGVRLKSGKKYHFTIAGETKGQERALFAGWLSRARP